jgi:hypothetical protein
MRGPPEQSCGSCRVSPRAEHAEAASLAASAAICSWAAPDTTVTDAPGGVCCRSDAPAV